MTFKYILRLLPLFIFLIAFEPEANAQLGKLKKKVLGGKKSGGSLSTEEIARGLKEALERGTSKGTDQASKVDGYFRNELIKIPFPPEARDAERKLRQIGLGSQVDRFVLSLNRAAEKAAKEAKPIFIAAIRQMTIRDATNILRGDDDAATQYLKRTTSADLRARFKPIIKRSLDEVNATKYYEDLAKRYNKIPFTRKKLNPNLDDYATEKALDGLFILVAQEEANIRNNPGARVSDLLRRVFN